MHGKCIMGHCAMHCNQVWVVRDSRKSALDIIDTCVAIVVWIHDCQVPVANAKLGEQICEVHHWELGVSLLLPLVAGSF